MISSENGLLIATVLLNVQGRDVGGFVDEARQTVARDVSLPAGYYLGWSGRWENQEHARQRLQVVLPIVLVIIFVLLYFTYHSVAEAAHVLLAVPFALTGGVYLLWLLGYNFSVAVWVGFIALFGTAVQTGVVMVIYLEEAVARRARGDGRRTDAERTPRGGHRRRSAAAASEGDDRLHGRRRPAADHVEHAGGRRGDEAARHACARRHGVVAPPRAHRHAGPVLLAAGAPSGTATGTGDARGEIGADEKPRRGRRRDRADRDGGGVDTDLAGASRRRQPGWRDPSSRFAPAISTIVLSSPTGTLHMGRNAYTIEFRGANGSLIDVGVVRSSANMTMPGMAMSGGVEVSRTTVPGPVSGDRRIRHGRRLEDGNRMGRPGGTRVGGL